MGVYIKGMKMPETCLECMNSDLRTAIRCTEWTEISAGLRENRRALTCHLIEVPEPHGRLIDADEITAFLELERNDINVESLDEFPTVIEAEDE